MIDISLLKGIGLIVFATLVGSLGALFFKLTSNKVHRTFSSWLKTSSFYFGFLFYGISALIFVYALRFGDLSTLYPVAGLSYIWVSLLSIKYLNEKMSIYRWVGIFSILLGIVFIGFGS
jgi:uncharacterized membrane protein